MTAIRDIGTKLYEQINELIKYYPLTGIFVWKVSRGSIKKGDIAGNLNKSTGYIRITVDRKSYLAHRLAYLLTEGYFPENGLDHLNRIRSNNRWTNLRETSQSCNLKNANKRKNNTSGIVGVCWHKAKNKWQVSININNKHKNIGRFINFEDAVFARYKAECKADWEFCNTMTTAKKYLIGKGLI